MPVGDRRHGAGVDEIGSGVVGIRAADVGHGPEAAAPWPAFHID